MGDVNNDNKFDIVVANYGSNNIGILLNSGSGTFSSQITYPVGSVPYSVAVGDMNRDNKVDIAVVNYGANTISVLLNRGNGTFLSQITYSTGTNPYSVVIGDMNGDNNQDIIVANSGSNTTGVLLGTGNGTFLSQLSYSVGNCPAIAMERFKPVDIILGDKDTINNLLNSFRDDQQDLLFVEDSVLLEHTFFSIEAI
ncbi:unnamed protein product [Adineta steineri]|uniref:VCBS repeat-containing protein n=1 Tax=Adineta steineri TaxID=433720 RepID=A0A813Y0L5_9BILA|nr:unnamed protein product [Adineta steineri]CAF1281509.1 unnamed protein product [Adineta steineri]CAF3925665.1 unnamed protein product [Adineta steineri]CAF4034876.1 unnamed protein product [Adineta steineri]